jgi:hypothetical protein
VDKPSPLKNALQNPDNWSRMPSSLTPVKAKNPMNVTASDPKSQDGLDRKFSPEATKVSPAKHYNDAPCGMP